MSQDSLQHQTEPHVPLANTSFNQLYLYAFATLGEVRAHIRTQTINDDADRLSEIVERWTALQPTVQTLLQTEAGIADAAQILPVPPEYQSRLDEINSDELFRKSFANVHTTFQLVDIDTLIAPQRTVNLDYVLQLKDKYRDRTSITDLIEICLSPTREMPPIRHLEIQNSHIFSSQNLDLRFLGAFLKELAPDDLKYAVSGGLPAAAIIAFVGYGSSPINVIKCGNRLVLNNGFHRVYALRQLGVTTIPVVVQHVNNYHLECPPQIAGLPREYLMGDPRPVLIKDYHQTDFCINLKAKLRAKVVTLQTSLGQFDVPS